MTKKQTGNRYLAIHFLILVLILLAIANAIDPHLFWEHFIKVDYPIHSAMEATGALAAIIMGLMSIRYLIGVKECRYEIISLSLLAMGSWDLFHAVLHEGRGFVLTHNISLLLGGLFFFLVIFNWSDSFIKKKYHLKIIFMILFVFFGILLLINRQHLPQMISESGHAGEHIRGVHFTPLANIMNVLAGIFFIIGSVRIYLDYLKYKKLGLLLLVLLGVQSASAGFLFPYSHAWADSWWFWHILRFLAFTGILTYMINQFSLILAERTKTLKEIQESENKFSRLFDSEPDALFIAEAETGIITQVNEAAQKLMKMSKNELVGISQIELHPPEKREEIAALFKEIALKGSRTPQQIVVQDSEGTIIPVEVVGNVIQLDDRNIAIGIFRDISDRIALEDERTKLDRKFKKFIEQVPLPLCILNQDTGKFSFFNNSFTKLFGYTGDELKHIDDWWVKAYPDEEYRNRVMDNWQEATRKAITEKTDIKSDVYNVTCRDSSVRNIIIGGVIVENELLATFIDITELREAEKIMQQQQDQLLSMFNGMDDIIYVADPDTYELLFINDVLVKNFGNPPKGAKCYEILQHRDSPCPFCTNDIILNKKRGEAHVWEFQNKVTQNWYRCFDKAIRWPNGKLVRFEMAVDVTEMKQTELAIINEKQMFESTIDSLPGIFYQINTDGYYERWNQRFKEVTGYNDQEMSKIHALKFFTEADQPKVANSIANVFKQGEVNVEADLVLKSGDKIPYMFNGRMFLINEKPYLIGMGMDISRLKKIENNLRKSNRELEAFNRIAVGREKRMIELKKMINQLSKSHGKDEPYDLSFVDDLDSKEEI